MKSLFSSQGMVGPHISQNEWDDQFRNQRWQYLGNANEREHYDHIIQLYTRYGENGTMLDIGCGTGVLYHYFKDSINLYDNLFHGIDISGVAIADAKSTFPGVSFSVVNYQDEDIDGQYDVVVFNETLYYFDHAMKTLRKCCDNNLKPGGVLIISMCDHERHDQIWKQIDTEYTVLDSLKSRNDMNVSWTVRAVRPRH